nr:3-isopropylmalate dehydratase small subunit 3-like [Ipomoea batatas]
MASFTTFFTLLLYTITVFLLGQGAGKNRSACPTEFSCGSLGTMKYPFSSNISRPECGLLKLECDAVPLPRIRIGRKYYYVYGKLGDYIRLYDPELEQIVLNRPRCNSFDTNVSFPNSPWVSFVIPHNFTVFKCSNTPNLTQQMNIFGYRNHTKCRDFSLFYRPPGEGDPLPNLPNHHGFPPKCSPILLPFEEEYSTIDLFDIISVTFVLEWLLSEDCSNCQKRGGQCVTTADNQFHCSKEREGSHFPALLGFPLCLVCITSTDVIVSRRLVVTSLDLRATITAKLNFVVYYREDGNDTAPGGGNLPAECSVVQLPFRKNSRASDLFRKLNSLISVEWETRFVEPGEFKSKYSIVIGGDNFGCGSSREHAPVALGAAGVSAVVAESYARIFFRNSVSTGEIYPLESEVRICEECKTGDVVTVELGENKLINHTTGKEYKLKPIGDAGPVVEACGIFAYARKTGMIPSRQA